MTAKTTPNYNNFFFQQQPSSAQQQSGGMKPRLNEDEGDIHDLHLKMSKKIAQLTKVVYALNSKNDEHENTIAFLKSQFDQEKEQLIQETSKKLEEYKNRITNNSDQSKQLAKLDSIIKEFGVQKEKAFYEFEQYKSKTSKTEQELVDRFCKKVNDMNKEIDSIKNQYEEQIQQFKLIISKFDTEKAYLIEDLKSKHRIEIENFKSSFNSNKDQMTEELLSSETEKQNILKVHKIELSKLQSTIDELKQKHANEKQDYENNIKKLSSLHEKELEALKTNANGEFLNQLNGLKNELEKVRKEKLDSEKELNKRYESKLEEIVRKDEEIEILKEKLKNMQKNLESSGTDINLINEELMKAKNDTQQMQKTLNEIEKENSSYRERHDKNVKVLLEKSNQVTSLEASLMQKSSTINDLKNELANLRERISWLEDEKNDLLKSTNIQSQNVTQELRSLEKAIAEMKQEKKVMSETYAKNIETIEKSNREALDKIEIETKIREERLINDYDLKMCKESAEHKEKILTLERNLNREFNTESQKVSRDRDRLQNELNKLLEELKLKTSSYDSEVKSLKKTIAKNEIELTEASSNIEKLTNSRDKLEIEAKTTKSAFESEQKKRVYFEEECEKLNLLLEASAKDSEMDTKVKLEKLSRELNAKWSENLKHETEALRISLLALKEEELKLTTEHLNRAKEEEIKNIKTTWQNKTNELLDEISILKSMLNNKEIESSNKIEKLRREIEMENKTLRQELETVQQEYQDKLRFTVIQKDEDVRKLIETLTTENEKKLSDTKTRYLEDIQAQMIAQKSAMSNMKAAMEKNRNLELEVQAENHSKEMEFMRNDLLQSHYLEFDDMKRLHEKELLTIRMELERAIEINKLKEREHQIKVEDYQSEMNIRQKRIESLNNEIKDMKHLISDLKQEIEIKSSDFEEVKQEAQKELKNIEANLKRQREAEFNDLNGEHLRQKQLLVNEFKQAQEIFKKRIYELEGLLEEMNSRYQQRESRDEDIEMIQSLKFGLQAKGETLKKLEEEKKYFQMELVNRETNFNKVFNNAPNIGVINPLNYKKSKGPSSATTSTTTTTLQSGKISPGVARLDPIPGGSLLEHHLPLNPNKPLPKKFLK